MFAFALGQRVERKGGERKGWQPPLLKKAMPIFVDPCLFGQT